MSEFENNVYGTDGAQFEEGVVFNGKKRRKASSKKDNKLLLSMVAIGTAFIVFVVMVVVQDRIVNQGMKQSVVVAIAEVPRGTVLTQENMASFFAVEQRVVEEIPAWITYTNGQPLVGMITSRDIHAKELVTTECFVPESFFDDIEDPVELSIDVSEIGQAVAGTLRPGDLIDIKSVVRVMKEEDEEDVEGVLDAETYAIGVLEPLITDSLAGEDEQTEEVDVSAEDVEVEVPVIEPDMEVDELVFDMDGNVISEEGVELVYGVTGNFATQTIAESVKVVGVYTVGGETPDRVEAAGGVMNATVINVVVPRSSQDLIFLAMEEGTIRISRVEPQDEEKEVFGMAESAESEFVAEEVVTGEAVAE